MFLCTVELLNIVKKNIYDDICSVLDISDRIIIICSVLEQNIKYIRPNYDLKIIPNNYDTAVSYNKMVHVKYMDHEYFPKYVAHLKD